MGIRLALPRQRTLMVITMRVPATNLNARSTRQRHRLGGRPDSVLRHDLRVHRNGSVSIRPESLIANLGMIHCASVLWSACCGS